MRYLAVHFVIVTLILLDFKITILFVVRVEHDCHSQLSVQCIWWNSVSGRYI